MFCQSTIQWAAGAGAVVLGALQAGGQAAASRSEPWNETQLAAYLERAQEANPELEAYRQHYAAAQQRIPQARALPDPTLQVTQFVESVQTRTGPQENIFMVSQKVPWFGVLKGRRDAAASSYLRLSHKDRAPYP